MRRALVTGGAGFIGSHLVEELASRGFEVLVIDNLSGGDLKNLESCLNDPNVKFMKGDLLDYETVKNAVEESTAIYHLAANPEVRVGTRSPEVHYRQNVEATFNLLEAVRKVGEADTLVFTSTSTVYGEATVIPTPEDYGPLKPISVYGASKLACESLIMAYAYTYGFRALIYRLANIVGPRSRHGIIYDFIKKLKSNPKELRVLGDGRQNKSYLYVKDCIEAMMVGLEKSEEQVAILNIGAEDQLEVREIAEIVIEEMGLKGVKIAYVGGLEDGRGWVGDVKNMLLDISKLKALGWRPRHNCRESVRLAARELIEELNRSK
ncbi:SDR family NAD(P)-dependent oxidoreductase [Candidatus Bathyarchaeota archaeon]|nr:MAG: SDR family NAD(P)-dependent oxidoreductase [Candidatus Bathyarchaeota archaeon]